MIKQQKNSNNSENKFRLKAINIIMYLLVIASLVGSYLLHHYTIKKMGMLRHIIYMNGVWEKTYPISAIKNISIILLIASIIFVFRMLKNNKNGKNVNKIHNIIYFAISVFTLTFILSQSKDTVRPYYMMSVCLILGSIFQFINIMLLKKR